MLDISSVLNYIHARVLAKDPRFDVLDAEHIIDTKTGIEFHMYDDWFKLSRNDETIAKMPDFTKQEQEMIWKIKQINTDPAKAEALKKHYPEQIKARRLALSDLFENPTPLMETKPVAESETTPYRG